MISRRRPSRKPPEQKGAPKWMVTFSDLVTLVLVFFILLFSMSQIDMIKFKSIAQSFNEQAIFQTNDSIVPGEYPSEEMNKKEADLNEQSLDKLAREVKKYLKENGLEDTAAAIRNEQGVVLVLQEQVVFGTGDAVILQEAYPFLEKTGKLLKNIPNLVKVEGHTDNRPIKNSIYPSNWELSSARASSVIRFFIDNNGLDSERFIAVGYGDTRPLVPNTNEENMQKNRRVQIVISDPTYKE
ncbi:flagellar motor protein MotS [Pseudobacillus wudalianchiensis]|uniref:Flagellar motor protein MotS n=1 Tax=Pseudobacillus wudalianchiensis TaxID=1743143 RepID=A0A1B9B7Z5_9BACI|nr:flagellar motor protein MotS [Bacillus wudalianchiensis]OCA92224.1 flagellar motor protein MotS [Bacillus wudalianchiensis]